MMEQQGLQSQNEKTNTRFNESQLKNGNHTPQSYEPFTEHMGEPVLYHNPSLPRRSIQDEIDDEELEKVFSQDREVEYKEDEEVKPDFSASSIRNYAKTRFTSLGHIHKISMENLNPIPELRKMTLQNWNYFFMGYFAWLCAAWAFFCVSVSVSSLSSLYDKTTTEVTWGLGLVLFVRSAGAVIFGFWTDSYSRKWPFITCLGIFAIAQICTPFCDTYEKFLGVRWMTGISMGGIYACASATAIEDAPVKARSFLSGLFFSAYAMGFIFAIIFNRAFTNVNGKDSWKIQFWFSVFLPVLLMAWRLLWPETKYFTKVLKARKLILRDAIAANGGNPLPKPTFKQKMASIKRVVVKYWLLFAYLVVLLVGPNYLTHASQDLLPTMLRSQLELSENAVTVIIVVTNLGAICGGMIFGQLMEVTGRRLGLLIACTMGGSFIYPAFMLKTKEAILGAGFMVYFCVFGVWGILPIHMAELAPADARALVSGLAYQLGNLASAASATIETELAVKFPVLNAAGKAVNKDYSKVMAILTGSVFIFTFVCVFVGHEKFHRDLSSPVMKKYINQVDELEADGVSINEHFNSVMVGSTAMKASDSYTSKASDEQVEYA